MTTRSVCTVVLLVLFVTVVHSAERSLLGNSAAPKTTDLPKKQEAGAKNIPPTPSKKQEPAKGRTAATGSANSKQAPTVPGQGARSGDVGIARTVTPVRAAPTDIGHRRALLDTPQAQMTTAATAAPKKQEAGAAKTTTPPKTTTASSSKQQEAAKGRAAVTPSNNTQPGSTAPGQGARSGTNTGDVGVARTVTPVPAVPFDIGHRRALLGTSPGPKTPAAIEPAKKDKPADIAQRDEAADLSKRPTTPTSKGQEAAKGRTASTKSANTKPASTVPGQGARSGTNTADVGISRTVTPVRAAPMDIGRRRALLGTPEDPLVKVPAAEEYIKKDPPAPLKKKIPSTFNISRTITPVTAASNGHRRALLGTSPAPKTAAATPPPQKDKPAAAPKKQEAGAAKTTTPPKTTTPAKTEAAKGRTAPAGATTKTTTPAETGARAGIGKFDFVLPGDPLAGKK